MIDMNRHQAVGMSLVVVGAVLLLGGVTFDVAASDVDGARLGAGVLTAVIGLALAVQDDPTNRTHWEPVAVERGIVVPTPGDDLSAAGEPAIRDRFRRLVAPALITNGYSPEEAETAIAEGTWTTDTEAADYLRAQPLDQLPAEDALDTYRHATLDELKRRRHDNH